MRIPNFEAGSRKLVGSTGPVAHRHRSGCHDRSWHGHWNRPRTIERRFGSKPLSKVILEPVPRACGVMKRPLIAKLHRCQNGNDNFPTETVAISPKHLRRGEMCWSGSRTWQRRTRSSDYRRLSSPDYGNPYPLEPTTHGSGNVKLMCDWITFNHSTCSGRAAAAVLCPNDVVATSSRKVHSPKFGLIAASQSDGPSA